MLATDPLRDCRILLISDLHMGDLPDYNLRHKFSPDGSKGLTSTLPEKLVTALSASLPRKSGPLVDIVIATGDFVYNGSKQVQFNAASKVLKRLLRKLHVPLASTYVVPGNHDVNRLEDAKLKRMSFYEHSFLSHLYDGEQQKAVYVDDKHGIIFCPLSSANVYADVPPKALEELVEENLKRLAEESLATFLARSPKVDPKEPSVRKELAGHLKRLMGGKLLMGKMGKWPLDCGFVTKQQIDTIENHLRRLGTTQRGKKYDKYLKVAFFHHNPVPLSRNYNPRDPQRWPESGYLANGPEILSRLSKAGITLVLHGHRHESSFVPYLPIGDVRSGTIRRITLVGAPSIGGDARSPSGFVVLDVRPRSGLIEVIRFEGDESDNDITFEISNPAATHSPPTIPLNPYQCQEQGSCPVRLWSSPLGFEDLVKKLHSKTHKAVMLHFLPSPFWFSERRRLVKGPPRNPRKAIAITVDPMAKTGPLHFVIAHISNNAEAFAQIAAGGEEQGAQIWPTIRSRARSVLRHGAGKLQALIDTLERTKPGNADSFIKSLLEADGSTARLATYSIEFFLSLVSESFHVSKGVYLWGNTPANVKVIGGKRRLETYCRLKFEWLLNSILAFQYFRHASVSWVPFSIQNYRGRSMVYLGNGDWKQVYIGWPVLPENVTLEGTGRGEVFSLVDENNKANAYSKDLVDDIETVIEQAICPISHRLSRDFPLLRDGKVYTGNLELIARIYKVELPPCFASKCDKPAPIPTISRKTLEELFECVVGPTHPSEPFLHWDREDHKWVTERCKSLRMA